MMPVNSLSRHPAAMPSLPTDPSLRNSLYVPTLLPALEDLLARGVPEERLEAVFQRRLDELRTSFLRVPLFMSRRFWALAEEATGDPAIGLELGCGQLSRVPSTLSYLFDVSASLEQGFGYLVDYLHRFNGHFRAQIVVEGDEVQVQLHDCGSLAAPAALFDYVLGGLCSLVRRKLLAAGSQPTPLRRLSMARPLPATAERYRLALGVPLDWQQPVHALHFDRELFVNALSVADPGMLETLLAIAEQLPNQAQPSLLQQACDHIATSLAGDSSLEAFCASRHMTKRTVTRRLQAQGWRYSELLDEYRRYRAQDLLRDPARTQVDIAEELGYCDLSSFSRAFGRWYGCSPGAWREADG
ncbi:HTH-type transcriptional activator RhaR [compost metagenome]